MKKAILLSAIILSTSCTTSNNITLIGSLHKSDRTQDRLKQIPLKHQPVFLFKTEIKDTASGRKKFRKLPENLKLHYDSVMLHTEQFRVELGEEYQVVKQLNHPKNQKILAFLYQNRPVQMVTVIDYITPESERGKIDLSKNYFLETTPEKAVSYQLYSGKDTILLNPKHILTSYSEYLCIIRKHGQYKVVSLEDKKRKCPKEKNELSQYNFN